MPNRWKRFTAALLLLLVAVTTSAAAGALLCSAESERGQSAHAAVECAPGADDCLFLPLAKVAATPALLIESFAIGVVSAAYVRPLDAQTRYRNDPDPPVKPPPA